jgi:phage tail-like protein
VAEGAGPNLVQDAVVASRFQLVLDGTNFAGFTELSGISSGLEVVDFMESTETGVVIKKLPGKVTLPTIVLKRRMTVNPELFAWHTLAVKGKLPEARKTGTLSVMNSEGKEVAKFQILDAWPSKIEIGAMRAGASEILFETVTIVCESIERTV